MTTLSEILPKLLKCEITGKTDLSNIVEEISKGSEEGLQSMLDEAETYLNNMNSYYQMGLLKKQFWPEIKNDNLYQKRALDGLANLKKFIQIIDRKTPESEFLSNRDKEKGIYNYYIRKIEEAETLADKLRFYRLAEEQLIDDKHSGQIDAGYADEKLKRVRSAIERLREEAGMKASDFIMMEYSEFKKQFEDLFPTMEAYMKNQGMILPQNAWELSDMFIEKAFSRGEFGKIETVLKRNDFIEFHKIIEARLKEIDPSGEESTASFTDVDKIVDHVIHSSKKINHEKHVRQFLKEYGSLKLKKPGLKKNRYIEDIGFTKLSNVSYDKWINKYNKSEKMLSNAG